MDSPEIEKSTVYECEDRVYDPQPSEVEKRELLYETHAKLLKLFKQQFWWVFILAASIVGGLIYSIAYTVVDRFAAVPLKAVEKNLAQAELLAERVKAAQAAAEAGADQVKAQLSLRQKDAQHLQEKFTGVDKQFDFFTERMNAEWKNAALRSTQDFKANQERISRLEALVKKMGDENEANQKAYADYKKQID